MNPSSPLLMLALAACAPAASMPPPIPLAAGDRGAMGVTGSLGGGSALPRVDAAVWTIRPIADGLDAGAMLSVGTVSAISGGGFARLTLLKRPQLHMAAQLEGGWLWASVGLPTAYKLADSYWLTTHPSVGYWLGGTARLPVGFAMEIDEHMLLSAEIGAGVQLTAGFSSLEGAIVQPVPFAYGAMSLGYRF